MKKLIGTLVSVHTGNNADYSKEAQSSVQVELDGFVGDKHRGYDRIAASYDPDPTGTVRRNERQWSGVSLEELAIIGDRLDLEGPLMPATLGANICVEGIPEFSRLARGSRLVFPSGAVLVVEEGNPPCGSMTLQCDEPADFLELRFDNGNPRILTADAAHNPRLTRNGKTTPLR